MVLSLSVETGLKVLIEVVNPEDPRVFSNSMKLNWGRSEDQKKQTTIRYASLRTNRTAMVRKM